MNASIRLLRSRIVSIFLLLVVSLSVYVYVKRLVPDWDALLGIKVSITSILFCSIFIILSYINRFFFWTRLTDAYRLEASTPKALRAYFHSMLGRYVPGKVGLFLFRLRAYTGVSKRKLAAAMATEYLAVLLSASLLILSGTLFLPMRNPILTRWLPGMIAVMIPVFLYKPVFRAVVNRIMKITRKQELEEFPSSRTIAVATSGYLLSGLLNGLALFVILRGITDLSFSLYPVVSGAYYLAGLIGMLAFFAPGGLGVREGAMFIVLSELVNPDSLVVATLLIRFLTIAVEIIMTVVSEIVYMVSRRRSNET